jgi:hypothetical protein
MTTQGTGRYNKSFSFCNSLKNKQKSFD